eukprot:CAMPEP_0170510912 /NCGR_PEP_ID=MMETSP0208-20121228/66018_1 /TAXON_ID=197538 /ORGANISM="Strombidium inclinatum, Strain S3" /LENGTH=130 /DNA_ID=CAMNT_0010794407 /DNA_START=507 /DNA_END=900 /DNA_ORIENTATION=-
MAFISLFGFSVSLPSTSKRRDSKTDPPKTKCLQAFFMILWLSSWDLKLLRLGLASMSSITRDLLKFYLRSSALTFKVSAFQIPLEQAASAKTARPGLSTKLSPRNSIRKRQQRKYSEAGSLNEAVAEELD